MDEKFASDNKTFFDYLGHLEQTQPELRDLLDHFPAYVGQVNLARFLSLADAYREVAGISGDIADFGSFRGGSFFTFAKLVRVFEPFSNTKVHGFDWFQGQKPGPNDNSVNSGLYVSSKEHLEDLIQWQGMKGLMELHDFDLSTELDSFLRNRPWLRFKLAFVDIGIEKVLESVLIRAWERIIPGGTLILDHFNHEASPTESALLQKVVGNSTIKQISYSRTPTAFVTKPAV